MDLMKYDFNIESEFNIRVLREDEKDIDIIIPLDNRTVNLYFEDMPTYIGDRIQCSMIKNIVIRLSKLEDNSFCTVHFLRSIDLHSSVVNFVVDYKYKRIEIENLEYSVVFRIVEYK